MTSSTCGKAVKGLLMEANNMGFDMGPYCL